MKKVNQSPELKTVKSPKAPKVEPIEQETLPPSAEVSSPSPAGSNDPLGTKEILAYLRTAGLPPTRQNYLAVAHPELMGAEPGPEIEAGLPVAFRKY